MNNFYLIIICSIAVETIFEIIKDFVNEDRTPNLVRIGSAIIGVLVAINYNLDVMKVLGINGIIPYFGVICTGLCISRGSNFIHELLNKISNVK